jgi:hypothetical protein
MSKTSKIVQYALAYIMWVVIILLWLLFMLVGREAIAGALQVFYMGTNISRQMQMSFFDRAFLMFTGIVWVILMIVSEHVFRVGVQKGILAKRIGMMLWPIMLLLFLASLTIAITNGFGNMPMNHWGIMFVEAVITIGLFWLSRKPARTKISNEAGIR